MNENLDLSKSINIIKGFSILLVIIGHVLRMYTSAGAFPHEGSSIIIMLCSFIYSFHMPLFIFLSGIVYGICRKRGKYLTLSSFLVNKSLRLLLPYVFFGILCLAPCMIYTKLSDDYIDYCIHEVLLGNNVRHLWYLLSLFEIFILVFLLRKVFESEKYKFKIFLLIFLVSLIYQYFISVNILQLKMTFEFLPYFVLGYYIGKETIQLSTSNYKAGIYFIIGLIGWIFRYRLPAFSIPIMNYIISFSFILSIFSYSRYYRFEVCLFPLLINNAMGIYLFHVIFLYVLFYHDCYSSFGLWGQIILMIISSLILSVIMTKITRLFHFGFILGEYK